MDKLPKCSYCGGTGRVNHKKRGDMLSHEWRRKGMPTNHYVTCIKCHARGPLAQTEDAAIDAWNTRAYDAEMERLKSIIERYKQADEFLAAHGWRWEDTL